jgi:hypothetical protein
VQFFVDGSHEYVRRNVPAKQAIEAAFHYTHNVAAVAGVTSRVIITDSDDMTCFEWISGEGITFPKRIDAPPKDYSKRGLQ